MKRFISFFTVVVAIGLTGWIIKTHPDSIPSLLLEYRTFFYKPCAQPVTYHIGTIDPRFHINNQQLIGVLKKAENIWELPTTRNLFEYDTKGVVAVNLTYDSRQENTDKLKTLGITLDDSRAGYDKLTAQYKSLLSQVNTKRALFNDLYKKYQNHHAQYEDVKAAQISLNTTIDTFNAVVAALNQMAVRLNITVAQYNTIGKEQGQEFEEGLYESNEQGKSITIYEFKTQDQLIRVLAHEMGHALGLGHTNNPSDIMYHLNESNNQTLTANDITAVAAVCR